MWFFSFQPSGCEVSHINLRVCLCYANFGHRLGRRLGHRRPACVLGVFAVFKAQHGKACASAAEEAHALDAFAANLARVEATDARPGLTYRTGLNQFSDMMRSEARARLFCKEPPEPMHSPARTADTPCRPR